MTKPKTRTISHDDYLKALGLFSLADEHVRKAYEYERALYNVLGLDKYGGAMTDAVWDDDSFDEALRTEGIVVAKPKTKGRRK